MKAQLLYWRSIEHNCATRAIEKGTNFVTIEKEYMKKLLLILILMLPLVVKADPVEIDGIYYILIDKAKIAEVTGFTDRERSELVIPDTVIYNGTNYIDWYEHFPSEFMKRVLYGFLKIHNKYIMQIADRNYPFKCDTVNNEYVDVY